MKYFAVLLVVAQAVLFQNAASQIIRNCGCGSTAPLAISSPIVASPIIASPSVASSLADTLSLLTVSSLLSETLPLNPNVIAAVPVPVAAPAIAPALSYGGCGCGCGYNNYGYNGYNILY
ncbi:uncharacterized protein LOC142984403 [Anticarsia gemmatalis]|uniref:uncharacterized protein LOC142984403 n=1 Tax=Anticarsia gemmatalis TaxID=129554 RepID=UPI003F759C99